VLTRRLTYTILLVLTHLREKEKNEGKWQYNFREAKSCQDGDTGLFHWNYLIYHFCQNKF